MEQRQPEKPLIVIVNGAVIVTIALEMLLIGCDMFGVDPGHWMGSQARHLYGAVRESVFREWKVDRVSANQP